MAITRTTPSGDRDADILGIWPGAVAKTGHGWHLFLKPQHRSNRAKLMAGIDYRGDGGYIVAAPSTHVTGRHYEWLRKGAMPEEAPRWLQVLLHQPSCPYVDPKRRSKKPCGVQASHQHEPTITDPVVVWESGIDRLIRGEENK